MLTKRLKELRTKENLTQGELAEKINVPLTTYANWEQGKRIPDYNILSKLADIYDCSVDYLIGRTNNKNEVLRMPDKYEVVITKAKDCDISPEALEKYIEILKSEIDRK